MEVKYSFLEGSTLTERFSGLHLSEEECRSLEIVEHSKSDIYDVKQAVTNLFLSLFEDREETNSIMFEMQEHMEAQTTEIFRLKEGQGVFLERIESLKGQMRRLRGRVSDLDDNQKTALIAVLGGLFLVCCIAGTATYLLRDQIKQIVIACEKDKWGKTLEILKNHSNKENVKKFLEKRQNQIAAGHLDEKIWECFKQQVRQKISKAKIDATHSAFVQLLHHIETKSVGDIAKSENILGSLGTIFCTRLGKKYLDHRKEIDIQNRIQARKKKYGY